MASKEERTDSPRASLPWLTVPKAEAERQITAQIDEGRQLLEGSIASKSELDQAEADYFTWDEYNTDLLRKLFDSPEPSEEYSLYVGIGFLGPTPLSKEISSYRRNVQSKIRRLESVRTRLPLHEMASPQTASSEAAWSARKVFLVHGSDGAAKESVARFLERLGLDAIVLHEKPSGGRTIIEKFEDYSDVGYAVVILTPDDICSAGEGEPQTRRPRQNVVFELGFFIGKLGRQRVCALFKEGTEIPSDYQGVVYVPMGEAGAWRLELAREMKHAGVDVDLNKAL
ncbi:MAG TPA: nucleotide-binding protein [Anaerolineae bacterium]|nr:nucleotide-binding protein [Anaerolineae bacterium]